MPFPNPMQPPVLDEEAHKKLKAARDVQYQAAIGQAQPGAGVRQAQNMGAAVVQQAGEQAANLVKTQGQQTTAEAGLALEAKAAADNTALTNKATAQKENIATQQTQQGLALDREQREAEQNLTQAELQSAQRLSRLGIETDETLSFLSVKQREQLTALGADLKERLFDSRLQFQRDEDGRKFSDARQLADFAIISSQNEMELQNKLASMKLMADRDLQLAQAVHQKIRQELKNAASDRNRQLDQQQYEYLKNLEIKARENAAKKQAKANNMSAIIVGGMTVAGAIVGSVAPGVGTAAGAVVGNAAGNVVASQTVK